MGRGASEQAGVAAGGRWGTKPSLSGPGERRGGGGGAGLGGANVGALPRETRAGQCPRRASDARRECGAARLPARTQPPPPPRLYVPAARITRDPAGVGTARAAPRTRPAAAAAAAAAAASSSGPLNPMSRAPLPSAAH